MFHHRRDYDYDVIHVWCCVVDHFSHVPEQKSRPAGQQNVVVHSRSKCLLQAY